MLPIPGETYDQYLSRVTDAGETPYLMSELRDIGWEELDNGELWTPQLAGEPKPVEPPAFPPDITEEPDQPGEEPITLVTIYFLVWCVDPSTGDTVGPYTQMVDVDWYNIDIATIEAVVDNLAMLFCRQMAWRDSPRNVSEHETTDYDWEIVSPFGIKYSRGM